MLKQVLATRFINHEKLLLKIDFHHYKHNIVRYLNFQKIVKYFLVVLMAIVRTRKLVAHQFVYRVSVYIVVIILNPPIFTTTMK